MCTGIEIAAVAALVSAGGSIYEAHQQQSEDDRLAAQATWQARRKASIIRYQAKQTLSAARASYSAAGVDVGSGSPLEAYKTISYNSDVDALNALASGDTTAYNLKRSGDAAMTAGYIRAGASVLGAYAHATG